MRWCRAALISAVLGANATIASAQQISEFVVVVSDVDRAAAALSAALGGTVVSRGPADMTEVRMLGLEVETPVIEAVIAGPPGQPGVRLMDMTDGKTVAATPIRAGAQWWDVGGAAALAIGGSTSDPSVALQELGWSSPSAHVFRGPDDLTVWRDDGTGVRAITPVGDLGAWRKALSALGFSATPPSAARDEPTVIGLPENAGRLAARRASAFANLIAWEFTEARGRDVSDRVRPPHTGVIAARVVVPDAAAVAVRAKAAGLPLAADLQIRRTGKGEASRAFSVRLPGGLWLEIVSPGAKPMSETELKERFAQGGYATWVRFNNRLTGNVRWNPDGTAHVIWDTGNLNERGTWTIKGDAVCTAWTRLRSNRELCVHHYRLDDRVTQAFRADGGFPDGIYTWQ
jgi:hypothetical protein